MNPTPEPASPNSTRPSPRNERQINRYRLTFDPNPKELARREAAGSHAVLLWSRRRQRAAVVVEEDTTGELVQLEVRERENPLELFEHPYAYISARGTPGRRRGNAPRQAAAARARRAA